jgi:hypothetical protein
MRSLETRAVLLSKAEPARVAQALTRALASMGFVEPGASIPKNYPVRPHEVLRFAWQKAGAWWTFVPSDLSLVFKVGLKVSAMLPGETVLAVQRAMDGAMTLKAYRDGRPAFKLGDDEDLEVAYRIMNANPEDLRALLTAEGLRDRDAVEAHLDALKRSPSACLPGLLAALGVVLILPSLPEILQNPDAPLLELVDEQSPLCP